MQSILKPINNLPKPGMLFANSLFGRLYLIVDVQYRKRGLFDERGYYVVYALGFNNKITGFNVSKQEITNLFSFLNWKFVQ
jgi:hypothetical protein